MTQEQLTPADCHHTSNGTPNGYTTLTPFLGISDPAAAIDFYQKVFGARLINLMELGEVVSHAELEFTNGRLQLGAAQPEYQLSAPAPDEETVTYSLILYCPDVDSVVQKAVAHGAVLRESARQFVSGDRFSSIRDPFGIRWSIMTRTQDLSDEESSDRVKKWIASLE